MVNKAWYAFGSYSNIKKEISVSIGSALTALSKHEKTAEEIFSGRIKANRQFRNLLYTKRLEKYLEDAKEPRAIKIAKKHIINGVMRSINDTLQHEICHATEPGVEFPKRMKRRLASAGVGAIIPTGIVLFSFSQSGWTYSEGIVTTVMPLFGAYAGISINDMVDPVERRARVFGEKYKNDPKWRNIITLIPRELALSTPK